MKIFTKEVKIALTAIVAIVLLIIGINFLKGINVFKASNTYYVKFHNINGLAVSNPVYANGYPVGIVRTISYDYNRTDNVVVGIELDKEMRVPRGTRAELEAELMGGVKMSLILGPNPTQNLEPGDSIEGGMHVGTLNKLEAMLPAIEQLVPKLDSILTNINRLTGDPALTQTLHNTAELTANLSAASARLNEMVQQDAPGMVRKLDRTLANTEQLSHNLAAIDMAGTLHKVNSTLDNAQQLSKQLNVTTDFLHRRLTSNDNTLGLFLNDRSVYDRLNHTMGSADSLLIDLRTHPKRYVHFSVFGRKDK